MCSSCRGCPIIRECQRGYHQNCYACYQLMALIHAFLRAGLLRLGITDIHINPWHKRTFLCENISKYNILCAGFKNCPIHHSWWDNDETIIELKTNQGSLLVYHPFFKHNKYTAKHWQWQLILVHWSRIEDKREGRVQLIILLQFISERREHRELKWA